jgi:hypothetical protein
MNREAEILQDRIEIAAFGRRRIEPPERIRRCQYKENKCRRDQPLHAQHIGAQPLGQIGAEHRNERGEKHQHQHPEQHGAFVIAPYAGDFINQRLRRVRILIDIDDREIRRDIERGQAREGKSDKQKTRERYRCGDAHQARVVFRRAPDRHRRLHQRKRKGEHQSIM